MKHPVERFVPEHRIDHELLNHRRVNHRTSPCESKYSCCELLLARSGADPLEAGPHVLHEEFRLEELDRTQHDGTRRLPLDLRGVSGAIPITPLDRLVNHVEVLVAHDDP